jgi:hypothetical protein
MAQGHRENRAKLQEVSQDDDHECNQIVKIYI